MAFCFDFGIIGFLPLWIVVFRYLKNHPNGVKASSARQVNNQSPPGWPAAHLITQDNSAMPPPAENSIDSAYQLYGTGSMQEVQALCEDILQRQPKNVEALYLTGLAHCRLGDTKGGRRLIKRACRVHPPIKNFVHMDALLRHQGINDIVAILERRLIEYKTFSTIDVFALSYPKCGRTWARLVLGTYALNGHLGRPHRGLPRHRSEPPIIHAFFQPRRLAALEAVRRHSNRQIHVQNKKVMFFVRDPRDVLVSYFFQYTLRGDNAIANDPGFDGSLSDFIRHPIGGLQSIVRFYNIWPLSAKNRKNSF